MCQLLCPCGNQESNKDNSSSKDAQSDMAGNVADLGSSCECPKKRKEHDKDELSDHCCKATKPDYIETLCTSGDAFMKIWMLPSNQAEIMEEQVEPWVKMRGEKWNTARGHDQVFMDQRPKGKHNGSKAEKVAKKIFELKEKIAEIELHLEKEAGHLLSKADKLKDEELSKLNRKMEKLKKLKKESKDKKGRQGKPLSVRELGERVEANMTRFRKEASRPCRLEDMTMVEKETEKSDLAQQMKLVEEQLGGLVTKESREVLSDLYWRLRQLKRSTRKPSYNGVLLAEIPENESIEVVSFSSRRSSVDSLMGDEEEEDEEDTEDDEEEEKESDEEEEWHTMTREELRVALKGMRERKMVLGKEIKEFQEKLLLETGRKASKDDREPIKLVYNMYKQIKQRIRLVDALLSKLNINN